MSVLTPREREIVKAFAETLIPQGGDEFESSAEMNRLLQRVDEHVGHFSADVSWSFRALLLMFDYGAILYRLRLKTFRKMDAKWRRCYLDAWHNSWLAAKRSMWRFLDAIIYINYYASPSFCEKIGYAPKFNPPMKTREFPHENAFISPAEHDIKEECDVCVIGSGAGGAVIAHKLAEAGRKVIILEEGGFYGAEDFGQDAAAMTNLLYRNGGLTNTFGWPAIIVPVGRCVGGTTTINSGTCFRTPDKVLDKWVEEFGLTTWSSGRMERHFAEIEKNLHVAPADPSTLKKNTEIFKRGIESLGFKGSPIARDAPGCCGSGVCGFGCPTNAKQSTNVSYIPMALNAGAKLYANCQAERFLFSGSHAKVVLARFLDPRTRERLGSLEVKARVVVLACGAFHTPVLLMRSHVPNPSGMIGHNLTIHPAAKVMALFDEEVRGWDEVPQGFYVDAFKDEGIMLEGIFLPPPYAASTILHVGERHKEIMADYNKMATFGIMVSDSGHGRILRMPRGRAMAIYNLNKADVAKFARGLEIVTSAFFAAGAKSVLLPLHTMPELTAEEGVQKLRSKKLHAKDLDLQAFHPMGTCRMGANPKRAACDQYGRFYGLDNVFVADGSIFPTSLGVNPMITIMAAAAKIGEYVDREVL